ncbi:cation diffusion facilitator family transporter [Siphonobacter sp. SORGH_AS_1065]|uniref:cation diffusion facilitator family transporter n=1 Tax=Siphonobacter sp. SORGH_AS_1065 TaxID=3041795 RepID=UPI002788B44E|nr:cation diffusion facilitator family transporter [Siphonobacter sp. SORGH_AS_1065]MDQ1089080.1 cobalt-zinc-cadmium efflux system protein [Siphonobacter sp. SORGH_AS_1065]
MAHSHAHDHSHAPAEVNRAFVIGIILNTTFVIVEAAAGFYTDSLALLTDAGHNLSDVASLLLAMLAFRLAKSKPTERFTYGYQKSTVLVSLANAVLLLVVMGGIGYEAFNRLWSTHVVAGDTIALIAGIGIGINAFTALLFFRQKEHDLNVKGAYLHLLADALVSAAVVAAGIAMPLTGWYWLDPVLGIIVALVVVWSTWSLLQDSLILSLDGVPATLSTQSIKEQILQYPSVLDVHHIHIWAMSTTENALTAHLVIPSHLSSAEIFKLKHEIRHTLEHLSIQHATLETETPDDPCLDTHHH